MKITMENHHLPTGAGFLHFPSPRPGGHHQNYCAVDRGENRFAFPQLTWRPCHILGGLENKSSLNTDNTDNFQGQTVHLHLTLTIFRVKLFIYAREKCVETTGHGSEMLCSWYRLVMMLPSSSPVKWLFVVSTIVRPIWFVLGQRLD